MGIPQEVEREHGLTFVSEDGFHRRLTVLNATRLGRLMLVNIEPLYWEWLCASSLHPVAGWQSDTLPASSSHSVLGRC